MEAPERAILSKGIVQGGRIGNKGTRTLMQRELGDRGDVGPGEQHERIGRQSQKAVGFDRGNRRQPSGGVTTLVNDRRRLCSNVGGGPLRHM